MYPFLWSYKYDISMPQLMLFLSLGIDAFLPTSLHKNSIHPYPLLMKTSLTHFFFYIYMSARTDLGDFLTGRDFKNGLVSIFVSHDMYLQLSLIALSIVLSSERMILQCFVPSKKCIQSRAIVVCNMQILVSLR